MLVVAPAWGLRFLFGAQSPDALTTTLARHWALLVALFGCLLLYAAFHAQIRPPIMVAAALEKLALGLTFGIAVKRTGVLTVIIVADSLMALLYIYMLVTGTA